MKKYYILTAIVLFLTGSIIADNTIPGPQGKHKSHKKSKKKKSGYYFNFQH